MITATYRITTKLNKYPGTCVMCKNRVPANRVYIIIDNLTGKAHVACPGHKIPTRDIDDGYTTRRGIDGRLYRFNDDTDAEFDAMRDGVFGTYTPHRYRR